MKKYVLFLLVIANVLTSILANPIDPTSAKSMAQSFWNMKYPSRSNTSLQIVQQPYENLYIFKNENGAGFIIMAANDICMPILAYSQDNNWDETLMPDNIKTWIKKYDQEIAAVVEAQLQPTHEITSQWQNLRTNHFPLPIHRDAVEPLLTTRWNQSAPYNNLCPMVGETHCVTGCVATAMAQIMKYWNYPPQGTGSYSYTCHENDHYDYEGVQSADFEHTTYDWEHMRDNYYGYCTETEKTAVATLMHHCGVSVAMMYGTNGSGAYSILNNYYYSQGYRSAEYAFRENFGYSINLHGEYRDNYHESTWLTMLKTDLNAAQPIYYSGSSEAGGHAFVCDGYDASDYFHFNWGWGGSNDGYFWISELTPGSGGIGGGNYSFNQNQQAIFGIKPDEGEVYQPRADLYAEFYTPFNDVSDREEIEEQELDEELYDSLYIRLGIFNIGPDDFYGNASVRMYMAQTENPTETEKIELWGDSDDPWYTFFTEEDGTWRSGRGYIWGMEPASMPVVSIDEIINAGLLFPFYVHCELISSSDISDQNLDNNHIILKVLGENHDIHNYDTTSICENGSIQFYDQTIDAAGEYSHVSGMVTNHLTVFVDTVTVSIEREANQLFAQAMSNMGTCSYQWSGGDTTAIVLISSCGTYGVTVASRTGCSATASYPVTFVYGEQILPLETGWNWFSTYISNDEQPLLNQLEISLAENGRTLVYRDQQNQYNTQLNIWEGSISSLDQDKGYKVKIVDPMSVYFNGILIEPTTPVTIYSGWTWLPYYPTTHASITDALANLIPQDGDLIKSLTDGYAQYVSQIGWVGSLQQLHPNQMYMYYSTSDNHQPFVYPNNVQAAPEVEPIIQHWNYNPHDFADNMTLTFQVNINDHPITSENFIIGAFVGEECRGTASLQYIPEINNYIGFLTISGTDNESIIIKGYDAESDDEYTPFEQTFSFTSDDIQGVPMDPILLTFSGSTNIAHLPQPSFSIYPNPTSDKCVVNNSHCTEIRIYDACAKLLGVEKVTTPNTMIDLSKYASGIYIIRGYADGQELGCKKIIKK